MRLASISRAISPYSPALSEWVPRLFSTCTPAGNQVNGARLSSPAAVQ